MERVPSDTQSFSLDNVFMLSFKLEDGVSRNFALYTTPSKQEQNRELASILPNKFILSLLSEKEIHFLLK